MKKKCFFILILLMVWVILNGQTGPVFPYNHPLKQTIKTLSLENSSKGYAFRTYLLEIINSNLKDTTLSFSREDIPFIFESIYFEEVYLQQGGYMNSGYNPSLKKMIPSLGNKWVGFAWVFRLGTFSFPLIKEDCGNILKTEVFRKKIISRTEKKSETAQSVIVGIEINNVINGDSSITEKRDTIISSLQKEGSVVIVRINNELNYENPFVVPEKITKKKNKFWNFVIPIIGASALATAYMLLNRNNDFNRGSITRTPDGNPGGAPITPPDGGEPGGSPTTP